MALTICRIVAGTLLLLAGSLPAGAGENCKCRANGQLFEQGQLACVRGKLLRCEMFLNNASWKTIADTCPEARLSVPTKSDRPPASLPSG